MQPAVDAVDELGDGLASGLQRLEDLVFPLCAMLQVLVDQFRDVLDDRSVAWQEPRRRELANAAQGCEVFREVAAFAGRDDDRSAAPGEIAAVEVACLFVEEAEVVRRVAGVCSATSRVSPAAMISASRRRSGG